MPVGVPGQTSVRGAMHGNVPAGTGTTGSRGAGAKRTPPLPADLGGSGLEDVEREKSAAGGVSFAGSCGAVSTHKRIA